MTMMMMAVVTMIIMTGKGGINDHEMVAMMMMVMLVTRRKIVAGFNAYMGYMHVEAAHTPFRDHLHSPDVAGPSEQVGQTAG